MAFVLAVLGSGLKSISGITTHFDARMREMIKMQESLIEHLQTQEVQVITKT